MSTPVDDMPIETRRRYWGWFGDPWPSYVCYDEDNRLLEEMRKDFPAGECCLYCEEAFRRGDNGSAMPYAGRLKIEVRHVHKECMLRMVTGSVSCMKDEHDHDAGQTYRQEALEVWEWVKTNSIRPREGVRRPEGYVPVHQRPASTEAIGGQREPADDQRCP